VPQPNNLTLLWGSMKERILALLREGKTYKEIMPTVGCSKPTISFHAKRAGFARPTRKYPWDAIQAYYNECRSVRACLAKFRLCRSTWIKAVHEGHLVPVASQDFSLDLCEGSTRQRGVLKYYLLKQGLLPNTCALCPQGPEWNGKPLVLVLDHINGVNNDNRLENLRLLCPNCNSQTDTFAGRNVRRRRESGQNLAP